MTDLTTTIEQYNDIITAFRAKKELYDKEKDMLALEQKRYALFYSQIHEFYAPQKTSAAEAGIQQCIKDIFALDLPVCRGKKKRFLDGAAHFQDLSKKSDREKYEEQAVACFQYYKQWEQLEYDFSALVAFRSLEQFALLWERDFPDKNKIFKYSVDPNNDYGYSGVNKPFLYYFNQMVLKKNIKFISKQMPTGYGKSVTNAVAIAWLFGVNKDNDVLLVVGNPRLVTTNINSIVGVMTAPIFSKVFPEYQKYDEPADMFSQLQTRNGIFSIADSTKNVNLTVISKETPVDGIRVRFLFLDDVCRSADAENNAQHDKDIYNFDNSWWKRNYNTDDFYIVVGGTAYSIYDILSTLIRRYSNGKMIISSVNKYTYLSENNECVFIKIPKLDPQTDESTYPHRFPTSEAREMRKRNYRTFMAMEQQQPLAPETNPFYWDNLQTYDSIPMVGRSEYCWATIDPVRVGGDNFAMPIFNKIGNFYYLVDCIYINKEQEQLYQLVVDKIIQHKITRLAIEKNTDASLKHVIEKMLEEQGVYYCEITEVYNYKKKEERITNMQNTIKTVLRFPAEHLYGRASQMGSFMFDIVSFSWKMSSNMHDDSIDATTMFCEVYVVQNRQQYATLGTFKR